MESNKTIKMSLSTFLLIFAIFAIIIMAFFLYNLYNEKITLEEKVSNANVQTNEDVNSETIDNTISSNEAENENDESNDVVTNEKFIVPSLTTGTMKNATDNNAIYSFIKRHSQYYSISIENGIPYIQWNTLDDEDPNGIFLKNLAKEWNVTLNNQSQKITGFGKQVVDVHIGGIGQDFTSEVIIFQMEDGTIEYSTIKNMMKNVTTQGKIESLNNIVKLQDVDVHWEEGGGQVTIVAIDKDNNCYDLDEFIEN